MIPVKSFKPTARHIACMTKLKAALDPELSAQEMLALASQLVGNLVALQDQRVFTPELAMAIVDENILIGNAEAVRGVASAGGSAN